MSTTAETRLDAELGDDTGLSQIVTAALRLHDGHDPRLALERCRCPQRDAEGIERWQRHLAAAGLLDAPPG